MSGGGSEGFSDLIAAVRRRQFKKRRLQSLRFSLTCDPISGPTRTLFQSIYRGMDLCQRMYI